MKTRARKAKAFRFTNSDTNPVVFQIQGLPPVNERPNTAHVSFSVSTHGVEIALYMSVKDAREARDLLDRAIAVAEGPETT